jgi:hypothetical protein
MAGSTITVTPTASFYVWFTKNDPDGQWPRISSADDMQHLLETNSIRTPTAEEAAKIATSFTFTTTTA